MDAPDMHAMTNCPDDETLAVFVEGKLKGAERERVVAHVADCADCRDIVVMATEETGMENVVRPKFGLRRVWPVVAAVAAAIALALLVNPIREGIFGRELREVNESFAMRQNEARLSIDGAHRPYDSPERGHAVAAELRAKILFHEAIDRAQEDPTRSNLHRAGLAALLAGERQAAVELLERALVEGESADLLNDATAAHIAVGGPTAYVRALELANRSLRLRRSPQALWNRALALQHLLLDDEAIRAWEQYIAAETDAKWKADAREHINDIRRK